VNVAIVGLNNWEALGSDNIPAELLKCGDKRLQHLIFKLCDKRTEERMPISWHEAVIIPLHKKGDKMECDHYRGISLLNTAYKIFSKILLKRLMPYVDKNIGNYQCCFRKRKSIIEQLSIIEQSIEKRFEYRQNIWQLFIDFKKSYDNIHRESLYNIMFEFGFPKKLVQLTKLCMEKTQYKVRVDNTMATPFTVDTGLKQGDAFSPILFNLALEKVVKEMQCVEEGQSTNNNNRLRLLGFADDLDIIGNSLVDIANVSRTLERAARKVGLKINASKNKIMELIDNGIDPQQKEGLTFEKVGKFKYLGATLSTRNDWSKEINIRINKATKAFYALIKFLNSIMISRRSKTRLYKIIIKTTLTYECEAWTTTMVMERKLRK